jgi:hypothetical protein
MSANYDVQQVCENGHQITYGYHQRPEERKEFCQLCGAPTIITCPSCGEAIRGGKFEYSQRKTLEGLAFVPSYCPNCGEPYPWTQKKIQIAIQIFAEFGDLDEQEKKTIEQDVENIAKDVPEAELSAMRIKRIWGKYGPICRELILELTSRTAAHILKGP